MLTYRILVYKNKASYTGVCLDLDIVEEDHASIEEARLSIQEAVEVYLESVLETTKDESDLQTLLYRSAPRKYWQKAKQLTTEKTRKKSVPQIHPFLYSSFGLSQRELTLVNA